MKKKINQKEIVKKRKSKANSLYVHIPFCRDICSYCDFSKLIYLDKWIKPYLCSLFNELDSYHIDKVKTIYIGGGTPTSLNDDDFSLLLSKLSPLLSDHYEFDVEANIDSLSLNKLIIMARYGVNRLSIGVQSSNDEVLKKMCRHYNFEDVKKTIKLAKQYIPHINVDLIYAYPNENKDMLLHDIDSFVSLDVEHISTYSLTIDKSTKYYLQGYRELSQDIQREFYDIILSKLRKCGYERYEVSNFARNKKYSKHNLCYWRNHHYYAIGLGASGYLGHIRYTNTKNIDKYIHKEYIDLQENISSNNLKEYYLITNLRLAKGFSIKEYQRKFNSNPLMEYSDKLEKLKKERLIDIVNGRIKPTDNGMMLLDRILLELI
jgi:oxygen-independent coproporphyrinogen-3 oxidase